MLQRPAPLEPFRQHAATTHHYYPATLTPPIYPEDRQFFHVGHEIPRPYSAAPYSHTQHYVPQRSFSGPNTLQLPGLATLASLAAASIPVYERSVTIHHSGKEMSIETCLKDSSYTTKQVQVFRVVQLEWTQGPCYMRNARTFSLAPSVAALWHFGRRLITLVLSRSFAITCHLTSFLRPCSEQSSLNHSCVDSILSRSHLHSMNYATSAPAATAGGQQNGPVRSFLPFVFCARCLIAIFPLSISACPMSCRQ